MCLCLSVLSLSLSFVGDIDRYEDCDEVKCDFDSSKVLDDEYRLYYKWNFHRDGVGISATSRQEYMKHIVPPAKMAVMRKKKSLAYDFSWYV